MMPAVQIRRGAGCGCRALPSGHPRGGRAGGAGDGGLAIRAGGAAGLTGDSSGEQVWEFGSSRPADEESSDSSYSSKALACHTDGTYLTESPGLQAFHVTRRATTGGRTVLCDGWQVAAAIRAASPALYSLLATVAIPSEYIHMGEGRATHYCANDTVLKVVTIPNNLRSPALPRDGRAGPAPV